MTFARFFQETNIKKKEIDAPQLPTLYIESIMKLNSSTFPHIILKNIMLVFKKL